MVTREQAAVWRRQIGHYHDQLVVSRGEGWTAFWGSEASQRERYDIFFAELPLHGATVLEVGCGFGDFLTFAKARGVVPARYLGIDYSDQILAKAAQRHPAAAFQRLDLLVEEPPFLPDYIIASGIMAVPLPDYEVYVRATLQRFFSLCRKAFALNFLSLATAHADGHSCYVEPASMLALYQRDINWRVRLLHQYRQNDFTLVGFAASNVD